MARQAEVDGIVAICATPHIRADHAVRIDELPARRAELGAALLQAGCRMRLLHGGEVAADMLDGLDDPELASVTLGGSGTGFCSSPPRARSMSVSTRRSTPFGCRGFRALLAHPERHPSPDFVDRLGRLIARGALVQVTAAYFTDEATRPAMLTLARAGVIHVLGSDAHSSRAGRRVELALRARATGRRPSRSRVTSSGLRITAPRGIVCGQDVVISFPPAGG